MIYQVFNKKVNKEEFYGDYNECFRYVDISCNYDDLEIRKRPNYNY